MDYDDSYVKIFMQYLDNFVANIRPDDPLPVRAPSYKVTETEIDGQIIDIVHHYLNHRECPPYIRSYVAHRVWAEIRTPNSNGGSPDDEGCDMVDYGGNQTFEPMKLIQDVTGRANSILVELKSTLSPSQVEALPQYLPVSQYAIKNTRRKMEDRHVILQDLNTLYNLDFGHPHAFYGVFDGHAGTDAAVYTAAHLHQYLIQNPLYEMDPVTALKQAFYFTDTSFSKKVKKERLKGGTTAVVALIREQKLVVAWLGDSQALLVKKRNAVQIVLPHKPENINERKRIEEHGGCVVNIQGTWRVLGQLAVSRAIGDVEYKPFVSSECDIKSMELNGDEDFMVLGCDGLWDTLEPQSVVNIIYSYLMNNNGDTDGICRCLVEAARVAGSEDNITALVVYLRPVSVLMEEESARIEQGQVPEMEPFVMTQKDALPASINAIFSPPSNLNPESPPFTPFEQSNGNLKNGNFEHPQDVIRNDILPNASVPQEVIIHDSDSDEGVGADIAAERGKSPEGAAAATAAPTEEEVDAALAELDSLPDGAGDAGDLDEEDEDWAYYKMEPQNETPKEDILVGELALEAKEVSDAIDVPSSGEQNEEVTKIASPSGSPVGSPKAPGSPIEVEGFVTSVELNTPQESYNTNLTINQSTEFLNGGVEQSSGPFSVYVSSSPEPASMESPPVQTQAHMEEEEETPPAPTSPSVEIVHAQSTVEVSPEVSSVSPPLMEDHPALIPSPDVVLGRESSPPLVENPEETARNFDELVSQAKQFEDLIGSSSFDPMTASITEPSSTFLTEQPHTISEESSMLINQLEHTVNEVSSVVAASPPAPEEVLPTEAPEEDLFSHHVPKAFETPLDDMMLSYHEDQNPLSDIIGMESRHEEPQVEQIVDKVSKMDLKDDLVTIEESSPLQETQTQEIPMETTPEPQEIKEREPTPVKEREPTPVKEREPTPVKEREPTPVMEREPTPVMEREPTPVMEREPTPVMEREPTPVMEREPTPVMEREPTPVMERETTPVIERETTPVIERETTPVIEREPTPVIEREPSPVKEREQTPVEEPEQLVVEESQQQNVVEESQQIVVEESQMLVEETRVAVEEARAVAEAIEEAKPKATPPKPSPRTVGAKTAPKSKAPLPASRSTVPPAATKKPLAPKTTATKPGSAPTRSRAPTSTAGASRTASATTSRLTAKPSTSTATARSKSSATSTVTRTNTSTPARTKTTSSTTTKPSTLPPSRMSLAPPKKAPATTKSPAAPKPTSTTTRPRSTTTTTSRLTNGGPASSVAAPKAAPATRTTTTSRLSSSSTLTKKTSSEKTTTTKSSTTTRKPLSATTKPAAPTTPRVKPSTATKDTKNTTNKLLSTSRTTTKTTKSTAPPTTKPTRLTQSKTNKTPGLKSKVSTEAKKDEEKPTSEEKKIADEEATKEKLIEETASEEVLVNGDH